MDYKKIIKSRKTRGTILRLLSFVPDKPMIELQYRIKTGRKLNLQNPQRYTEKLQWYKLYYHDPLMARCVDKYEVRKYVEALGLGHILNECYGVFDRPEDIDFDKLPNQFVLKDTLGGGGNSVIICKDKSHFDWVSCVERMREWTSRKPVRSGGREWVYYEYAKSHRIICEQFLTCANDDLPDYKFFCFQGRVEYVYFIGNRILSEHGELAIMDNEFHRLEVSSSTQTNMKITPSVPDNYLKMKRTAEILSQKFPQVRVDLYAVGEKIYFGELTFFGASGYQKFEPDQFDFIMGEKFRLPINSRYCILNKKENS